MAQPVHRRNLLLGLLPLLWLVGCTTLPEVPPIAERPVAEDFEGGTAAWTGDWALAAPPQGHSAANSLTDSPGGAYPSDADLVAALVEMGVRVARPGEVPGSL